MIVVENYSKLFKRNFTLILTLRKIKVERVEQKIFNIEDFLVAVKNKHHFSSAHVRSYIMTWAYHKNSIIILWNFIHSKFDWNETFLYTFLIQISVISFLYIMLQIFAKLQSINQNSMLDNWVIVTSIKIAHKFQGISPLWKSLK